jgi:hypothetical protein
VAFLMMFWLLDRLGRVRAKFQARSATKTVRGVVLDKSDNSSRRQRGVLEERSHEPSEKLYCRQSREITVLAASTPTPDYELHAEKDGAKSQTRNVSALIRAWISC